MLTWVSQVYTKDDYVEGKEISQLNVRALLNTGTEQNEPEWTGMRFI